MSKNAKTSNYIIKGIIVVAALVAALLLIAPVMVADLGITSKGFNLFDIWDAGLKDAPADYVIMTICYSVVFFAGLIVAVLALLSMFVDNKLLNQIAKILVVILAVLAIVGLICNFVYINGDIESKIYAIGAGGIVSTIFAVVTAAMVYAEKALK